MMFTAALPLVCVTLAAIYLQPCAAEGKPVHHVSFGQVSVYKGDASKSTVLFFEGYDNNGVTRVSTVYADETEGIQIKQLHDDEGTLIGCEYTGQVHDGYYTRNPKPAHLKDNDCAIRDAPNDKSTYEGIGTLEIVSDEEKIQYEVKQVSMSQIQNLRYMKPYNANQGLVFHVSNVDLTVYIGDDDSSTVLYLKGQDQNGVSRITTAYVEEKEGNHIQPITSPQDEIGICSYPAKVHNGAYSVNPKIASLVQSCIISIAPNERLFYQDLTLFEVDLGQNRIRYEVNSVQFSTIEELEKMKP